MGDPPARVPQRPMLGSPTLPGVVWTGDKKPNSPEADQAPSDKMMPAQNPALAANPNGAGTFVSQSNPASLSRDHFAWFSPLSAFLVGTAVPRAAPLSEAVLPSAVWRRTTAVG